MKEIIHISLENEMDLVLAHRRTMQVGEQIGLTIATRTTFATAVSEVTRTVIEYTDNGNLKLTISGKFPRFSIYANISFDSDQLFRETDEGFFYAKKLLPDFEFSRENSIYNIKMGLGLPRSLKMDEPKIVLLKNYFDHVAPINSYEQIKKENNQLNQLTTQQEEEIRIGKELDEKKNEFISVASHELKTPITVVKAYTQMLKLLKSQYSEKVGEVVEKLDMQTGKLARLAQQLMDVSRMENGSLQYDLAEINFNEFLQDAIQMLSAVHQNNTINVSHARDSRVNADPMRLEQVLTNLLGNAAKYSAKYSIIDITVNHSEDGKEVIVAVSDQGLGMSQDEIQRIFDKFYRVEDIAATHAGLGMGLYISSRIISDHGGRIWVDSEIDKGSTFYFTIPVCAEGNFPV